jgi:anti-sigma B factor antagonist
MNPALPTTRTGRNLLTRWGPDRRLPARPFAVTIHDRGAYTVVEVSGELDVYTAPDLRNALLDVAAAGRTRVVVDLLGVGFMDSTALGVLVGGYKRLRSVGGDLRIVRPAGAPAQALLVTGLHRVLPMYTSVQDAVDEAAGAQSD